MGASKRLAAEKAAKADAAAIHADKLAGLYAIGGSIATAFSEIIPQAEHEGCADSLLSLLNDIEATKPYPEFRQVVLGALNALGFEPVKR